MLNFPISCQCRARGANFLPQTDFGARWLTARSHVLPYFFEELASLAVSLFRGVTIGAPSRKQFHNHF